MTQGPVICAGAGKRFRLIPKPKNPWDPPQAGCRRVAAPRGRTASDPRIQRAIRYLEDHLTQKITLQQLATQAGLSREYFCTLFHQQTGKTVFAYLRWARIQLAKER